MTILPISSDYRIKAWQADGQRELRARGSAQLERAILRAGYRHWLE